MLLFYYLDFLLRHQQAIEVRSNRLLQYFSKIWLDCHPCPILYYMSDIFHTNLITKLASSHFIWWNLHNKIDRLYEKWVKFWLQMLTTGKFMLDKGVILIFVTVLKVKYSLIVIVMNQMQQVMALRKKNEYRIDTAECFARKIFGKVWTVVFNG